jgi:uncharacterized protein YigE (DUF2233 family)
MKNLSLIFILFIIPFIGCSQPSIKHSQSNEIDTNSKEIEELERKLAVEDSSASAIIDGLKQHLGNDPDSFEDYLRPQSKELIDINERYVDINKKLSEKAKRSAELVYKGQGELLMSYGGDKIRVFVVNVDSSEVELHLSGNPKSKIKDNNFKAIMDVVGQDSLLMITNAGMFTPSYEPEGFYLDKTKISFPIDLERKSGGLNFYLQPNGVFAIESKKGPQIYKTEDFKVALADTINTFVIGTQSGPMLVYPQGEHTIINPEFKKGSPNKKIRSAVAINKQHPSIVIFAISKRDMNFYDFSSFLKDNLGATYALFLDGAISQMYTGPGDSNCIHQGFGPMLSVKRKSTSGKK